MLTGIQCYYKDKREGGARLRGFCRTCQLVLQTLGAPWVLGRRGGDYTQQKDNVWKQFSPAAEYYIETQKMLLLACCVVL